jgi:hypothetical protein
VAKAIDWAAGIGRRLARISLAGFSQPCSLNLRLALALPHGRPFRSVLSFCGGLPGEWTSDEQGAATDASRETAVYFASTTADPFYSVEQVKPFGERLASRFGPRSTPSTRASTASRPRVRRGARSSQPTARIDPGGFAMPMFEYRRDGCQTRSEILVLAGDLSGEGSGPVCPRCGSESMQRLSPRSRPGPRAAGAAA